MKRFAVWILVMVCLLALIGCTKKDEVLHLGLNAEILEIDANNQILYVRDSAKEGIFGGKCAIDCKELITDQNIIYVDYETGDLSIIGYEDLMVGDKIIINAYDWQLGDSTGGPIKVEQIQLGTQRLDRP